MWVTDLRHFLDTDGTLVEGRARRIAIYLSEIVQAATLRAVGGWSLSEVRCRRRPGHKRCTRRVGVRRTEAPPAVEWECSGCRDGGTISGWEGTRWDLVDLFEDVWSAVAR